MAPPPLCDPIISLQSPSPHPLQTHVLKISAPPPLNIFLPTLSILTELFLISISEKKHSRNNVSNRDPETSPPSPNNYRGTKIEQRIKLRIPLVAMFK